MRFAVMNESDNAGGLSRKMSKKYRCLLTIISI